MATITKNGVAPIIPAGAQQHHFFASTAFDWAVAPTRAEAIAKVAKAAGRETIKTQRRANGMGLYAYSCRVDVPQDQPYDIANYAPSVLVLDDKPTGVRVPTSGGQHHWIVDPRGFVVVED